MMLTAVAGPKQLNSDQWATRRILNSHALDVDQPCGLVSAVEDNRQAAEDAKQDRQADRSGELEEAS
jgi:uncharacterized alpha-E superfamily protein